MNTVNELSIFAKNIYSQNGEDGIIEEILKRLKVEKSYWCVEFGAWDGIHLSNTCNLIRSMGFNAVLIEGSRERHKILCQNFPESNIFKLCAFVDYEGRNSLDHLLSQTPIPSDFDFLSIDIDGCDYYIFESIKKYNPKIICIEFNPTIPNDIEFIQEKNFSINHGSSALSLFKLAIAKGYSLVATTKLNLIFVRNDVVHASGLQTFELKSLRDDSEYRTYLFVGYDGTILSNRSEIILPWHSLGVPIKNFQPLPKILRKFPTDYRKIHCILMNFFTKLKRINLLTKSN